MTVPTLNTDEIATYAYYQQTGCTYVQLVDVLPVLHSFRQFAEYVDGTIRIYDTGSESGSPNNYVLVNIRVRVDGWIMAWFPRTLMTGTAGSGSGVTVADGDMQIQRNGESSPDDVIVDELAGYTFKPTSGSLAGNEYTIKSNTATTITLYGKYGNMSTDVGDLGTASYDIIQSRGNLVWWSHAYNETNTAAAQTTRLGRALYEVWEALKTNQQGGSGASLDYSDVGYWDYEYPVASRMYIFGAYSSGDYYQYNFAIPEGVTIYAGVLNHGGVGGGFIEDVEMYSGGIDGYVNSNMIDVIDLHHGVQRTVRVQGNQAFVILTPP